MKKYSVFLFDLDGTLVDSSKSIIKALELMEEKLHLQVIPLATKKKFIGPSLAESIPQYYGVAQEDLSHAIDVFREVYKEKTTMMTVVYPYVEETLMYIKQHNQTTGVATLKYIHAANEAMEHTNILHYMDVVEGTTTEMSTKAELIQNAITKLGCEKEDVVFFGDSVYDGVGAKAVGVDFVGLSYGFGFADKTTLDAMDCVQVLEKPEDLLSFVKEHLS